VAIHRPDSVEVVEALRQVDAWPCNHVAVGVVYPGGEVATHGEVGMPLHWASVTKLTTAVAALVAVDEGIVSLEDAAGPPGSTLRHLLSHASGLPFTGSEPIGAPGRTRIYSNTGIEVAAGHVGAAAGMPFAEYFQSVWGFPLGGSPAFGVVLPLTSLLEVARELMRPERISADTLAEAVTVQFAGLNGIVPGIGRFDPNDWGLGPELKDGKNPHWTGAENSPATFGHFGGGGGFLWVDPVAGIALGALTDHEFGDWALEAWPHLSDAVIRTASGQTSV
jgi:CubicO group peptidase (beta-lactamase class C family)